MRTVKQVATEAGISVRTLHYYDEIGLLKPSQVTGAGWRLYDEQAMQTLQQILFFRELDFPLKDILQMMQNSACDKSRTFAMQKVLLQAKRDRLNRLLALLDQLIEGKETMNFEAFDMREYTQALETFLETQKKVIRQYGGDAQAMERMLETLRTDGPQRQAVAEMAVAQYGSIEEYTKAMKANMENYPAIMEKMQRQEGRANEYSRWSAEVMEQLTADLKKDVATEEVQRHVQALVTAAQEDAARLGVDMGSQYWQMMADWYETREALVESMDRQYGKGASAYFAQALREYLAQRK
jgi:DNA-binding transcriptional MerR regulator